MGTESQPAASSSDLEQLIGDVEEGEDVYISRGDEYVAVLVGYDRYEELTARLAEMTAGGEPVPCPGRIVRPEPS